MEEVERSEDVAAKAHGQRVDRGEARRLHDRCEGRPELAGLLDRHDDAVATMRKAVRDDPDALSEAPRDSRVADAMRNLLTHYRNQTREDANDVDALFMTAAMRHLLGENALAYFAASKAIEAGDRDDSALILKGMIQRSLDAQPDGDSTGRDFIPAPPAPASSPNGVEVETMPGSPRQF